MFNKERFDPQYDVSVSVARELATAICVSARCALPGWPMMMLLSRDFFDPEIQQSLKVGVCHRRSAERDVLVILDFNLNGVVPLPEPFTSMLLNELKPPILGVGEVRAYRSAEGIVLVRSNDRSVPMGG